MTAFLTGVEDYVAHAMVIFFGTCSGVVFGNVTVRTPFSIDALISSLCGGF